MELPSPSDDGHELGPGTNSAIKQRTRPWSFNRQKMSVSEGRYQRACRKSGKFDARGSAFKVGYGPDRIPPRPLVRCFFFFFLFFFFFSLFGPKANDGPPKGSTSRTFEIRTGAEPDGLMIRSPRDDGKSGTDRGRFTGKARRRGGTRTREYQRATSGPITVPTRFRPKESEQGSKPPSHSYRAEGPSRRTFLKAEKARNRPPMGDPT